MNASQILAARTSQRPGANAEHLAQLAILALHDEADLSPKPALVDRRGSGAHSDLTLGLMHASARALWPCFAAMAEAGAASGEVTEALRETVGRLGREGEASMLAATGGVNTHRGAIWALGLLVTAAAQGADGLEALVARAAALAQLRDRHMPQIGDSHGVLVSRRYGTSGAREQAQAGFPAVLHHGLPQLWRSRAAGHGEQSARLDALLAIMATLTDSCVLYRAGEAGLQAMHAGAQAVLDSGGSATLAGRRRLHHLDRQLLQMNASPGGAADLLAACLLLDRLSPGHSSWSIA